MKNYSLIALAFTIALGLFLYVYFGVIFIIFVPPLFLYLYNKYQK